MVIGAGMAAMPFRARLEDGVPVETASSWALILIIVGSAVAFAVLWVSICHLLSWLGGWRRLAGFYPAQAPGGAFTHRWQSGQFGFVTYRRCLNVQVTAQGLRIEAATLFWPGHAPLFLPWSAIHRAHIETWLIIDFIAFDVGEPRLATVRLPASLFADDAVPGDLLARSSRKVGGGQR
jgi:hypothetical protein